MATAQKSGELSMPIHSSYTQAYRKEREERRHKSKARKTMNAPIPWDLANTQPETHEAWVCDRINQHFQNKDTPGHLVSLWKLDNYHYNIGIFVASIADASPGHGVLAYYIVVKYGTQFFFLRRNEPLDALLALDGDRVFTEFLENVMGKVIEPTEAQIRAFVEQFPLAAERWLAATMNESFQDHPSQLHDYRLIQVVFEHYDDRELHLRAERYFLHWWEKALIHEFPQPEWKQIGAVLRETREKLYVWWKGSPCVDYSLPPPPAIDHDRRRAVFNFTYKGKTYKRVEAYGQVALLPVMMEFHSREKPGYVLVDLASHKEISSWLPTSPGGRDAARDFARQVSRLTDMQQVPAFSRQKMYGAEIRIHELLCATYEKFTGHSQMEDRS